MPLCRGQSSHGAVVPQHACNSGFAAPCAGHKPSVTGTVLKRSLAYGVPAKATLPQIPVRQAQMVHGQHVHVRARRAARLQLVHDVRVEVFPVGGGLACHLARKIRQVLHGSCTRQPRRRHALVHSACNMSLQLQLQPALCRSVLSRSWLLLSVS